MDQYGLLFLGSASKEPLGNNNFWMEEAHDHWPFLRSHPNTGAMKLSDRPMSPHPTEIQIDGEENQQRYAAEYHPHYG
jgi:hypothetical protein